MATESATGKPTPLQMVKTVLKGSLATHISDWGKPFTKAFPHPLFFWNQKSIRIQFITAALDTSRAFSPA